MKSDFEKKLKNKAFEYGKKQIEERCFSLAIVNSEFKKMIDPADRIYCKCSK